MKINLFLPGCLIFFPLLSMDLQAQTVYGTGKPEIKPVWNRIADFSPTLRSVESAEFSSDGKYIVSGSKFGAYLMLWRVADGELLWEKQLEAEIEAVCFSPDGKMIAAGDEARQVSIFDHGGGLIAKLEYNAAFDGLAWSPDGDYLAGGTEGGEVVIWETVNWTQHRILKAGSTVNSLEFTGNTGMLIAAGNKKNTAEEKAWDRHGFVKAWDISKDWEVIFDIPAQKESSKSVRLSPDEKTFAVAGFANQVKIFSFPEGNEIKSMETNHKIEAIAFHPEGNFLFAGGHGENVLVYRTGDYDLIMEYPCKRVEYIDFSSDGRLMITGHEDSGFIKLHLFMTSLESPGAYQKLSKEILNNKDLD